MLRLLPVSLLISVTWVLPGSPALAQGGAAPPDERPWYRTGVVYGVVPPFFGPRGFEDVRSRLDELKAQGVDALWICPVQQTDDPSAISFAISDYFAVRRDFGTAPELRALVSEAHARGMRVLLDFVPNHASVGHPYYQDAAARGRASPFFRYFARDRRGRPLHYFNWENLKNLDFSNPAVRTWMRQAFAYWVRDFEVDGFRVDAVWGIRERSPDFLARLNEELRSLRPGLFLLAEASARDPYYVRQGGFDAAYDWTEKLGEWAWTGVFDKPEKVAERLSAALVPQQTPRDQVARFLNNNDTGDRFITRHGVETTRLAAILQHTLPGIPLVYMGDETGAEFRPYDDPPPLTWEDPHRLRPLYRRLAELREELPALATGTFRLLPVPGHPAVVAFLRDAGRRGAVLVVLNFGKAARVRLPLPLGDRRYDRDALTGEAVVWPDPGRELALGAKQGVVLVGR